MSYHSNQLSEDVMMYSNKKETRHPSFTGRMALIEKKKTISYLSLPSMLILDRNRGRDETYLQSTCDTASSSHHSTTKITKFGKKKVTFGNIEIIDFVPGETERVSELSDRKEKRNRKNNIKCQCAIF